jgi:formylglycine-generating enzyme required for sulfatase activity
MFLEACLAHGMLERALATEPEAELLEAFVSELVPITPGRGMFPHSFEMGTASGAEAEGPVHRVTFDYDFAIAKYEVPQNLYAAVMGANPSRWKGPRNSVERVTCDDAREFCRRLTELLRSAGAIRNHDEIRLPSEAEWEYCCRAGTMTAYSFGERAQAEGDAGPRATLLDAYAWHTGNAAGNDPPVGALKPNPWGLYDMHGYLWEFVSDAWHDTYAGAPAEGSSWNQSNEKVAGVARGGSWREMYGELRSAARRKAAPGFLQDDFGFRCVKAAVKPAAKEE